MDHTQYGDGFAGTVGDDFIGDDIGQAGYGFFVRARYAARAPGRKVFESDCSNPQSVDNLLGSYWIVGGNEYQLPLEIVERVA